MVFGKANPFHKEPLNGRGGVISTLKMLRDRGRGSTHRLKEKL